MPALPTRCLSLGRKARRFRAGLYRLKGNAGGAAVAGPAVALAEEPGGPPQEARVDAFQEGQKSPVARRPSPVARGTSYRNMAPFGHEVRFVCAVAGHALRPEELRALADLAHQHGLWVQMDGARLVTAAAALDLPLAALSRAVGVDALAFGGSKHRLLGCEAVLFFAAARRQAKDFARVRKQDMQLNSKMRFVSAHFEVFPTDGLWRRGAQHSIAMARRLEAGVGGLPGVEIAYPVQADAVFARIPKAWVKRLRQQAFFYVWDGPTTLVQWMTSFDTSVECVDAFIAAVRKLALGECSRSPTLDRDNSFARALGN